MKQKIRHCKYCDEPFVVINKKQIFCNRNCRDKYYYRQKNPLEERICEYCENEFVPKHNNEICCSKYCAKELHRIKRKKFIHKLRREYPELYYNELGSKETSVNYRLYRDKKGEPDWKREEKWVKSEKKRLGL